MRILEITHNKKKFKVEEKACCSDHLQIGDVLPERAEYVSLYDHEMKNTCLHPWRECTELPTRLNVEVY